MKRQVTWVLASCLVVLALALVSCATAPSAAPTAAAVATAATTAVTGAATAVAKPTTAAAASPAASPAASTETPKPGGVLNVYLTNDPTSFDPSKVAHFQVPTLYLTNEELIYGDWSRGPAGTNEFTHIYGSNTSLYSKVGELSTGWKLPEPGHFVITLRQGDRFALNQNSEASKLVNGREVSADDVVFSLNRIIKNNPYVRSSAPHMVDNTTITAPDKYTVDIKTSVADSLWVWSYLTMGGNIVAPEIADKYGDYTDWKNNVGSGPFMLTDYTSGASATFVKNPTYWDKDSVGPGKGNQLPYLDGVKVLILPDPSTRLTAVRTGKLDWFGGIPALVKDDFNTLMSTTPKLQSVRYMGNGNNLIYMHTDKPDLPFKDVNVRRALTMAIDYKSIVDKLMLGDGEYPGFPTLNIPDFKSVYFPLSEASPAVQDMYTYNPTKAKQMLATAGYPNGFSANIIVDSTGGIYTDQLAVIKNYWSAIGVDLTIKPMEFAALTAAANARNFDQMLYYVSGSHGIYIRMINWVGGTVYNGSFISDDKATQANEKMQTAMAAGDQATADATYKEFEKYAMEQQWTIPYPAQYNYTVWWPWLKNYHGELNVGFDNGFKWTKWVWLDQNLKQSMAQ